MSDQVLKDILGELKNLNHRLDNLEEGQKKGFIKVDSLETKVDSLDARMGTLETKVDSLDARVGGLETKMDRMEANQLKLETRIENEVIDKIRVLFVHKRGQATFCLVINSFLACLAA